MIRAFKLRKIKTWLLRQPLLLPASGLSLAIYAIDQGNHFPTSFSPIWVSAALVFLLSAWTSRKLLLISLLLSFIGSCLHQQALESQTQATLLSNKNVEIYGIVNSSPRITPSGSTQTTIKILQGPEQLQGLEVLSYIPQNNPIQIGEKIWLKGNIRTPNPTTNPDVFDRAKYLHRKGIPLELSADQIINTNTIATTHTIDVFAEKSRQWIRKKLSSGIEDTKASKIILAMFLGEKPSDQQELMEDFRNSGTIHVFAVSGLHVMMIGLIATIIFKLFRCPSNIWIPSVIVIMFFYAIVTGMRPPAMRASIMGAIVLTAILLLRKPSLPNCLWLSAILALLWDTHSLFLPGFQLSYAVLIAIAYTSNWCINRYKWINYIDPFFPLSLLNKKQKVWLKIRKHISDTLAVSTSAWFGSALLIWIYFGLITPLAIIASVPLMLIVFLILATCCLSLTLGSISPSLGNTINQLNAYSANTTHSISKSITSIPHSRYHARPWLGEEKIVIYHLKKGSEGTYLSLGGGILLDAGDRSQFQRNILPSLEKNGAPVDTLIATHPDVDHIQGLTEAIYQYSIKQLIIPNATTRSQAFNQLLQTARENNVNIIKATETTYPISTGISLEIIHIPSDNLPLADDRCLVPLIHWYDKKILFLSDSGHYFTHWLRKQPQSTLENIQPDLLVLGKHSREESIHPEIIQLLSPKTIIATQSYYPQEQSRSNTWINSVKAKGIKLYLLDQSGAITVTQDKEQNQIQYHSMLPKL